MPRPLVSTVPKYAETRPKRPPSLDPALSRWFKIHLQVSWKKVATATEFIVAVEERNAKVVLSKQLTATPASHKTMEHWRSEGLNVAQNGSMPLVTIKAQS